VRSDIGNSPHSCRDQSGVFRFGQFSSSTFRFSFSDEETKRRRSRPFANSRTALWKKSRGHSVAFAAPTAVSVGSFLRGGLAALARGRRRGGGRERRAGAWRARPAPSRATRQRETGRAAPRTYRVDVDVAAPLGVLLERDAVLGHARVHLEAGARLDVARDGLGDQAGRHGGAEGYGGHLGSGLRFWGRTRCCARARRVARSLTFFR